MVEKGKEDEATSSTRWLACGTGRVPAYRGRACPHQAVRDELQGFNTKLQSVCPRVHVLWGVR